LDFGAGRADADAEPHDGIAVNTSNALHAANTRAFTNGKRKLILDFALECFFIVLFCLTMVVHSEALGLLFCLCAVLSQKLFSPNKPNPKKRDRELTTAEVITVFAIAISGFYILIKAANLIFSTAFIIPIGIIIIAIRSLYFSKAWAASQTSKPASN